MLLRKPRNARTPHSATQPNFRARTSMTLPLQSSLTPQYSTGSGTPTYTRNLAAYVPDFEGRQVLVPANAARFAGARVVRNGIQGSSNDLSSASWSNSGSATHTNTTITFTASASDAVKNANIFGYSAAAPAQTYAVRLTVSTSSGTKAFRLQINQPSVADYLSSDLTATTTPQIFTYTVTAAAATNSVNLYVRNDSGASAGTIVVSNAQVEIVTGQSNQNPSEYVSVGVLSAPYHGLGIDGIKAFSTIPSNTVSSNVVTEATGAAINSSTAKWASLPGASGSYFSTAQSTYTSPSGDYEVVFVGAAPWTTGGIALLGTANSTIRLDIQGAGAKPRLTTAGGTVTADNANPFADGTIGAMKALYQSSSGNITFYYSYDKGTTWVTNGAVKAGTAGGNGNSGTLILGAAGDGSAVFAGRIYRAQIYNTIGGTVPVVDFNPNDHTSGATFPSSTTGETWTINGNAKIFGSNSDATYGIPAPFDANGPTGYLSEGARTTYAVQTETLSLWGPNNATATDNQYVAPNGATTMSKVVANAGSAAHYIVKNTGNNVTSAAWTFACTLRYVNNAWAVFAIYDGTAFGYASFNLSTGAAGSVSAGVTSTITQTAQAGVYRVTLTKTVTAGALNIYIGLNNADSATYLTWGAAGTETIGAWGFSAEPASFASSYTPNSGLAGTTVTRPADVLTYPTAGNIDGTKGTAYLETSQNWTGIQNNNARLLELDSAGNRPAMYLANSSGLQLGSYDGTNALLSPAVTAGSTVTKVASKWGGTTKNNYANGTSGAGGNFDGDFNVGANMLIGAGGAGSSGTELFGTIRNVRIWTRALADGQIAAL